MALVLFGPVVLYLVSPNWMAWASFDAAELDTAARHVAALMREAGITDVDILQAPRPDGDRKSVV